MKEHLDAMGGHDNLCVTPDAGVALADISDNESDDSGLEGLAS